MPSHELPRLSGLPRRISFRALAATIAVCLLASCTETTLPYAVPTVTTVSIIPRERFLHAIGESVPLIAITAVGGYEVTGRTVTWSSADPGVAVVNGSGVATAVADGHARIVASVDGASDTAAIIVVQTIASLDVTPAVPRLASIGETLQLTAAASDARGNAMPPQAVTWSSSAPEVASVDRLSGVVTAIANGIATITAAAGGGRGIAEVTVGQTPAPVSPMLQELVIPNLPSPYYRFEYDQQGRVAFVSFASNLTMQALTYEAGRLVRMTNDALGNRDRLEYSYDASGRVASIQQLSGEGVVFVEMFFTYAGARLIRVDRNRRLGNALVKELDLSLSFHDDGNLLEIREHRPAIANVQTEATRTDRFEQYDDKVNVDAFSLLHRRFFDQLYLLPGVTLQKGNPAVQLHVEEGNEYRIDFTYTYDGRNRPVATVGELTYLSGPYTGLQFPTEARFTYY